MKISVAAALVVACVVSGSAHAQGTGVPTFDLAAWKKQVESILQGGKAYALQGKQYEQEFETYMAFVREPDLGAAMRLMNEAGLSNDLPVDPMAMQSMLAGTRTGGDGISGLLQKLQGVSTSASHVFTPTDGSWSSEQLIAGGNGAAAAQAMSGAAYDNLRRHMPILAALRDRLATATTPAERDNAMGALQTEQAWHQNMTGQIQAIDVNARAAADTRINRDNQSLTQSIEQFVQRANRM